jgi:hypothetical protein
MTGQFVPDRLPNPPAQRIVLGGVIEMRTPMDNLPINDPKERRALSLRFAIDTRAGIIFGNDKDPNSAVDIVIAAAKKFDAYILGETDDNS